MGSALAADLLEGAREQAERGRVDALASFVDVSLLRAATRYLGVVLEALGFTVARIFSEWQPWFVRHLEADDPWLARFFWHGVGRAKYFAPTAALPLVETRRRVLEDVAGIAAGAGSRDNAVAGFAWAATLVNLRTPSVLECLVVEAERLHVAAAFSRGMHDALDVWRRCAPHDAAIGGFLAHDPRGLRARESWRRVMSAAGPRAVRQVGELFQVPAAGGTGG
jgi:hypothetical protein